MRLFIDSRCLGYYARGPVDHLRSAGVKITVLEVGVEEVTSAVTKDMTCGYGCPVILAGKLQAGIRLICRMAAAGKRTFVVTLPTAEVGDTGDLTILRVEPTSEDSWNAARCAVLEALVNEAPPPRLSAYT